MAQRRPRVFFPWERRRGALAVVQSRGRLAVAMVVTVAAVLLLVGREGQAARVRATRASLSATSRAVASYRADHGGACPRSLGDLVTGRYARDVPVDAWGHPLRLTCPGRRDPERFDLSSDGPDGLPGGLDRVE